MISPREQAEEDYKRCRQVAQTAYNISLEPEREKFQKVLDVIEDMRNSMKLAEQAIQPFVSEWYAAQDKAKTVYDIAFKEERDKLIKSRK